MDRREDVKNKVQNTMRQEIHQERERAGQSKEPTHGACSKSLGATSNKAKSQSKKVEKLRTIRREASLDRHHEYIVWERDGAESQSQRLWR